MSLGSLYRTVQWNETQRCQVELDQMSATLFLHQKPSQKNVCRLYSTGIDMECLKSLCPQTVHRFRSMLCTGLLHLDSLCLHRARVEEGEVEVVEAKGEVWLDEAGQVVEGAGAQQRL